MKTERMADSVEFSTLEIKIVTRALELLSNRALSRGEPLSALSRAAEDLGLGAAHTEISRIHSVEQLFAPNGGLWNNAEVRLVSLRAALRFATRQAVAEGK